MSRLRFDFLEGESHEVRHPEDLAVGKRRLVVIDPETDGMAILGLLHVTSLETAIRSGA